MTDTNEKALLPPGLGDVLAPNARIEAETVTRLMAVFESYGYERVKPPLIEFEDSLLSGKGAAIADQTFRLMDPVSQRMLALRPDMTLQVARIAESRLGNAPRPLRLAYAGEVVRINGGQLRPERQFGQVGVELIGSDAANADAEVILMALEAMGGLGIGNMSVDIGIPSLVGAIVGDAVDGADKKILRQALDRKDTVAIKDMSGLIGAEMAKTLGALLDATGPAASGLNKMKALGLGSEAGAALGALESVINALAAARPDLSLTVDPVENRGFEYHTGVSFTFFAKNVRGELGCGGRYVAGNGESGSNGETATGFTLFMDTILRSLPQAEQKNRLYLAAGTDAETAGKYRAEGWIAVLGMDADKDVEAEAKRLHCTHILDGGNPRQI